MLGCPDRETVGAFLVDRVRSGTGPGSFRKSEPGGVSQLPEKGIVFALFCEKGGCSVRVETNRISQKLAVIGLALVLSVIPVFAQAPAEDAESGLRAEVEALKERLRRLERLLLQLQDKEQGDQDHALQRSAEDPATTALGDGETGLQAKRIVELAASEQLPGESASPVGGEAAPAQVAAVSTLPSAPTAAEPQAEQPIGVARTGGQNLTVTGLVDTYYSNNFNNPSNGTNALYYTNPNSKGFGLNQAKLELEGDAGPIGFRTDIWFGSGARLFRDGLEPGPLEDVIYLQQAYGTYAFNNGAKLDVGLFGTIAGLEVAESHLNWNYSRGLLWAWNEPFSHLGARFSVPVSDTFTGRLILVNGFDNAFDNNSGKSYGYQGSWAPSDRFNTTLTFIHGPENDGTNDGWQKDLSWNFYAGLHPKFEVMANFDGIWNTNPDETTQRSWGIGLYARWKAADKFAIAQRYEYFDDTQARSTGIENILKEYTLTFEYAPEPRFITRLEYRRDWSTTDFFLRGVDGFTNNQDTLSLGFMWILGPSE